MQLSEWESITDFSEFSIDMDSQFSDFFLFDDLLLEPEIPPKSKKQKKDAKNKSILSNFSIKPAKFYIDSVIKSLNCFDHQNFRDSLFMHCAEHVQVIKNIYYLPATSNDIQSIASMATTEFNSIESFSHFLAAWNVFVPDGVFEARSIRNIVNTSSTALFMSELHFSGNQLVKEIDLLNTPFEKFDLSTHDHVLMSGMKRRRHGPCEYTNLNFFVKLQGSLAVYVNRFGRIKKIEVFLRFVNI